MEPLRVLETLAAIYLLVGLVPVTAIVVAISIDCLRGVLKRRDI